MREVTKDELLKMTPEQLCEHARDIALARRIPMTMRNAKD